MRHFTLRARRHFIACVVPVVAALLPLAPVCPSQSVTNQSSEDGDPFQLHLSAPIGTWDDAVPLGNGLTGGLLWGEGATIRLSLDRADLWDLRTPQIYLEDDWNYATVQRLVQARNQRELVRRFDAPFEEIPYPTKLPGARLEMTLADGRQLREFALDMRRAVGRASFDGGDVEVFFSAVERVAMLRVRGTTPTVRLVAPASLGKLGYAAAKIGQDASGAWLMQQAASGLVYAVHVASRRAGDRTELAVAITSNRERSDPLALARARTASALSRGFDALLAPHLQWWRAFWATSSIELPDAAIRRHYALAQYFYGAASRRGAPPMPLQGVWTADAGALPPWKGDFHFDLNVEMSYWAYLQAGHFDEGAAYLDFMWSLVPAHRRFAARFFDTPGIVVPGVMALDGQPLAGWGQYSLSPVQGAWVADAFYRHWRYIADARFLADRAYPYCTLVADGLVALLKPDAQGRLKLPLSSSPEIHDNSLAAWMTPLTNYDLSLIRSLFGSLAEMATSLGRRADVVKWSRLLDRLDPLAVDGATGVLKVSPTESLAESHRHLSHLMAIHPLGLLTIAGGDGDRRVIAASLDRLAALGTSNWVGYSFAWAACMEARAGRADDAERYLSTFVRAFLLRNGFHANGDQTRSGITRATYRPFTLEGNFAAAQAVHEMLLQSWGGVVRVFPAIPARWRDAAFTDLRAEGGYKVSARRSDGRTIEVRVEATRDGAVKLRDPFEGRDATWTAVRTRGRLSTLARATPARAARHDGVAQFEFAVRAGDTITGRLAVR
jgi:alpha-L-fucosidase 2